MPDLEAEDIQRLLSRPAATIPGQLDRRKFLMGALATAGALGAMPAFFDGFASAATPVGADEGILLVLQLGGGNDGLNTVVPIGDATYLSRRGKLAITNPLPITSTLGLHPALGKLKARYDAGKVAIVQGVGQPYINDLSHFSSTASWMAGTAGYSRSTGWLGRWLDGVPESSAGLRAVTLGTSIPLHLAGQQAVITAVDTTGDLFGADRSSPYMVKVNDALIGFASGPTGKGPLADKLAAAEAASVKLAGSLNPIFTPAVPDRTLSSQLTVAARLINANLGIRVFNASLGSFDTHDNQAVRQASMLAQLDAAIDAFYRTLSPTWAGRVTIVTFSEFGRRIEVNASNGTDHGSSSPLFVVGDRVKGGLYGQFPRLDRPDARGNPLVHVDYRSVYASILGPWLKADPVALLGGSYEDLGLFATAPAPVTPPDGPAPAGKPATPSKATATIRGIRGTASVRGTVSVG